MRGAKERVSYRVPPSLRDKVRVVARERGMLESSAVRAALQNFIDHDQQADDLSGLENRLAASLTRLMKDVRMVRNDVHLALAMVNVLAETYLLHTPPLPESARDSAAASAADRHRRFTKRVIAQLQGREGLWADLAENADEVDPEVGD